MHLTLFTDYIKCKFFIFLSNIFLYLFSNINLYHINLQTVYINNDSLIIVYKIYNIIYI